MKNSFNDLRGRAIESLITDAVEQLKIEKDLFKRNLLEMRVQEARGILQRVICIEEAALDNIEVESDVIVTRLSVKKILESHDYTGFHLHEYKKRQKKLEKAERYQVALDQGKLSPKDIPKVEDAIKRLRNYEDVAPFNLLIFSK